MKLLRHWIYIYLVAIVLRYFTKHNLSFISKYWFGVKVKIAQKNSNTIFVLYHHEDSCTNSL